MHINESHVEAAALDWLSALGYEVLSGLAIAPGEPAAERSDYKQVFLFDRLQTKLEDLNPNIPLEGLQEALRKLRLVNYPTLIENNRAFHRVLVEGVDVEFRNKAGEIVHDKVWLIDFANPEANEFPAVNQFTVEEGHFNRRPDVVVFINGIPLAVLELKNIADESATNRKAFDQFQTYKAQIPSLFHSNALLVISDGHQAKLGTITSDWERFMTWRTITGKELVAPGSLQLETLLKGVFDKTRLLEPTLKEIARELVSHVRKSVTIDWTLRESAQAQIRVLVRRILRKYGYPPDKQEKATQTVLEQAKLLCAEWAE
jgi:type I restriction enzyme R subunit